MHVCILTSTFPVDDSDPIGRFAYDFCLELSRHHKVTVITQSRSTHYKISNTLTIIAFDWKGKDIPLAELSFLNPLHVFFTLNLFASARRTLDNYIKDQKVDYCFALWAVPSGIGARYLKRRYGVPYDVWCLGSDIWKAAKSRLTKGFVAKVLQDATNIYADGFKFAENVAVFSKRECRFLPSSRKIISVIQQEKTGRKTFLFI